MLRNYKSEFIRIFATILICLVVAFLIIFFSSNDYTTAFSKLLLGPLKSVRTFGNVIEMMIPFIFTGLAVSIMFQAKELNLGADGAFYIGATVAAIVAIKVALPIGIHPLVAILVGGLVGAMACAIPGVLKIKWKANEIVSSLMMNYVFALLSLFVLNLFIRDFNAGNIVSLEFLQTARLPNLIPHTRIHSGIIIALIMVICSYLLMYKNKLGYEIRMTGQNQKFAKYSGINTIKVMLTAQLIGGFLAGVGGATEILGMYTRHEWASTPGYGWDGFIVATLARYNPAMVPIAAFFLAYLRVGADAMSRYTDIPSEVVIIIQAIMIVLISAEGFLSMKKYKRGELKNE